jgi:hypothetical protein
MTRPEFTPTTRSFSDRVTGNVRRTMYAAGWSANDLAIRTGIDVDTLMSRFAGESFNLDEFAAIAVALNCDVMSLVE